MAVRIRPRRSLTGPLLEPELPELADAVEKGLVGEGHIREVCRALDALPAAVSRTDREYAERTLVRHAIKHDANFVAAVGRRIADVLNPDGLFDDRDRARRRGLVLGRPHPDEPPSDPTARDERSSPQRLHDAITLGLKAGISSGNLGQHRGTPVSVIVTTTLSGLDRAASAVNDPTVPMPAPARTGGGSSLPMRDLIRMASDAIPYLAVFEDHTQRPLYLGRAKRVASADQRLICYARDRGCTHPDCMEPGYHCEVHHATEWADGGATDADNLFFACESHHGLISQRRRRTKIKRGRLAWTDGTKPPDVNRIHHPHELLRSDDEDADDGDR